MLPLDQTTFDRAERSGAWAEAAAAAFSAFETLPMPDPKEEVWRYVDIPADLADTRALDAPGADLPVDSRIRDVLGDLSGSARIVDGFVTGIETGSGPALRVQRPDEVPAAAASVPADLDRFAAAAGAFGGPAVVLEVPAGTAIGQPYLVEVEATAPGAVSFPRVVIDAAGGSESHVVVHYRSADGVDAVVVPQIEVLAGANARPAVTTIQEWGDATVAVAQQRYVAGRDAAVSVSEFGLGGRSARLHITFDLVGQGSDATLLGLYFGDDEQTLDYRGFVNHAAPNTTSEMFLKGAVGDRAKSVFTGLIRIEPEGQKTNAHQTNRNLVLSEGAEAHSVPNLEILANDVRCGHGSAVGPLDEEQRYYLMSRGLDRQRADRLQVKGFFEEVLARFPIQGLEPPLRRSLMAKYDRLVAGGSS